MRGELWWSCQGQGGMDVLFYEGVGVGGIERGRGRENWSYVQKRSPLRAAAKYKPGESEDSRADHRRGQGHPRAMVT